MLSCNQLISSQHHYGVTGACLSTPNQRVASIRLRGKSATVLEGRIRTNMQALREAAELSRPQLGARCSPPTSGQQIERIEKGQRRLTIEWVERIAKALRVEPEMLVGGGADFTLATPVANEAAEAILTVATGSRPDPVTIEIAALLLKALLETFVRHPEARSDPGAARPIVDFLSRQFAR